MVLEVRKRDFTQDSANMELKKIDNVSCLKKNLYKKRP